MHTPVFAHLYYLNWIMTALPTPVLFLRSYTFRGLHHGGLCLVILNILVPFVRPISRVCMLKLMFCRSRMIVPYCVHFLTRSLQHPHSCFCRALAIAPPLPFTIFLLFYVLLTSLPFQFVGNISSHVVPSVPPWWVLLVNFLSDPYD